MKHRSLLSRNTTGAFLGGLLGLVAYYYLGGALSYVSFGWLDAFLLLLAVTPPAMVGFYFEEILLAAIKAAGASCSWIISRPGVIGRFACAFFEELTRFFIVFGRLLRRSIWALPGLARSLRLQTPRLPTLRELKSCLPPLRSLEKPAVLLLTAVACVAVLTVGAEQAKGNLPPHTMLILLLILFVAWLVIFAARVSMASGLHRLTRQQIRRSIANTWRMITHPINVPTALRTAALVLSLTVPVAVAVVVGNVFVHFFGEAGETAGGYLLMGAFCGSLFVVFAMKGPAWRFDRSEGPEFLTFNSEYFFPRSVRMFGQMLKTRKEAVAQRAFWLPYEAFLAEGSIRFFWRELAPRMKVTSLTTFWTTVGVPIGVTLLMVVMLINVVVGTLRLLLQLSTKQVHWLCVGVTAVVTAAMAFIFGDTFAQAGELWLTALATGILSAIATAGAYYGARWLSRQRLVKAFFAIDHASNVGEFMIKLGKPVYEALQHRVPLPEL